MDTKKLKSILKKNAAPKSTFGTNPTDPWSTKAEIAEDSINETALLNRYLKSRGINAEFATKDQKVAHSKTLQFKKWMRDHMNDSMREDFTTDPTITHKKKGQLQTSVNKQKEIKTPHGPGSQFESVAEETLDEISSELLDRYKEKAKKSADELHSQEKYGKSADRQMNIMKATGKQIEKTTSKIKKALRGESLEPEAACNQPGDGANNPDDTVPARSKKMKLLLGGKKRVTEELYDHEKEDKSVAGLKKPKVQKPGMDDTTKESPQAAAVMKGGKTLTGEPRDTIEIDPMMKMRKPSQQDSQKGV